MIIEGNIAVKAAIMGQKREIEKILYRKKEKDVNYILSLAEDNNIPVFYDEKIEAKIIAYTSKRKDDDLKNYKQDTIFVLNGIEDPHNYGYALRSIYAFGYDCVISDKRDFKDSESIILRSSAGAYDLINLTRMDTLEAIKYLKKDYEIIALQRKEDALNLYQYTPNDKCVYILGGERRGIKKEILDLCDKSIYIPYGSKYKMALNADGAISILASELYRKKNYE